MRYKPRPIGDPPPTRPSYSPAPRSGGSAAEVRSSTASLRDDLDAKLRALREKNAAEAHYLAAMSAASEGRAKSPTPAEVAHVLAVVLGLPRGDAAEACRRFAREDGAMNLEAFLSAIAEAGGGLPKPS